MRPCLEFPIYLLCRTVCQFRQPSCLDPLQASFVQVSGCALSQFDVVQFVPDHLVLQSFARGIFPSSLPTPPTIRGRGVGRQQRRTSGSSHFPLLVTWSNLRHCFAYRSSHVRFLEQSHLVSAAWRLALRPWRCSRMPSIATDRFLYTSSGILPWWDHH